MRHARILVIPILIVISAGCASSTRTRFATIRVDRENRAEVFDAALAVCRQHGFRFAEIEPALFQAQSLPMESTSRRHVGRLQARAVVRRMASLYIRQEGNACTVMCGVDMQRADTQRHDAFDIQRSITDVPNETPIQQGEGLTRSQRTVWTDLGRDRALERTILQEIARRLTGQGPPAVEGGASGGGEPAAE